MEVQYYIIDQIKEKTNCVYGHVRRMGEKTVPIRRSDGVLLTEKRMADPRRDVVLSITRDEGENTPKNLWEDSEERRLRTRKI